MPQSLVIKDVFGKVVSGSEFSWPTTEWGSTQVIRVSFDREFEAGESATLPVEVIGSEGKLVSSASLSFNETTQEHLVVVKGESDSAQDGSKEFTLRMGPVTVSNPADYEETERDLEILNSDQNTTSGNVSPSEPSLKLPLENAKFKAGSNGTTFQWEHAYDADGDELLYHLCFGKTANMKQLRCLTVDESNIVPASGVAGSGIVSVLLIMSMLMVVGFKKYSRNLFWRLGVSLGLLLFIVACGNQKLLEALNLPTRPQVKTIIPTRFATLLNENYNHWRVYADDQKGHVVPSSEARKIKVP